MTETQEVTCNGAVNELRAYLGTSGTSDAASVLRLLGSAWDALGLTAVEWDSNRVYRAEALEWDDPVLRFKVERHGGTVLGSTRADLYTYEVDLDRHTFECTGGTHRQLYKMNPRMDARKVATQAWEVIEGGQDHAWVKKRYPDGRVELAIGQVVPADVPKQTLAGRRKRFRDAMGTEAPPGWHWDGRYAVPD
jgi:hypothetical protein